MDAACRVQSEGVKNLSGPMFCLESDCDEMYEVIVLDCKMRDHTNQSELTTALEENLSHKTYEKSQGHI